MAFVVVPWLSQFDGRKKGERLAGLIRNNADGTVTVHEWITSSEHYRAKYTFFDAADVRPATLEDFKRFKHKVPRELAAEQEKAAKQEIRYFGDGAIVLEGGQPVAVVVPSWKDPEDAKEEIATRFGTPLEIDFNKYPPEEVPGSGGREVVFKVWINEVYRGGY